MPHFSGGRYVDKSGKVVPKPGGKKAPKKTKKGKKKPAVKGMR